MQEASPLDQMRRLERQILGIIAYLDVDLIGRRTAQTISQLQRDIGDARLDLRDFETADTRAELVEYGKEALKRLDQLRTTILKASESGIFSSVDVIEMTTSLDRMGSAVSASFRPGE
ncbi:MAG TPA: hypothetical protein VK983_05785 [Candidatus Limnocylindrales bacterium]|nr:hypothetical protein [Candidatus Limnocylindrales bacterium]